MPQFFAKHTQGPCPIVVKQKVLKISISMGTRKMRYRLVSPEEAGESIEIELGIPRGAAGSSSNELTVRGCPIAGDLCDAPSLTRVKFSELGAAEIASAKSQCKILRRKRRRCGTPGSACGRVCFREHHSVEAR